MTTRRGTARRPAVIARPRLTWKAFQQDPSTLTGGTTRIFDLSVQGVTPTLPQLGIFGDYTIRRCRWKMSGYDTDSFVSAREVLVYWGLTVVSADAFASGSGALPDPRTDAADWFGYGIATYRTSNVNDAQVSRFELDLDVRSMRKVNENSQVPALVLSSVSGELTEFVFAGRMLVSHGRQ